MQELDGDVADILRDLVDFLECLDETELTEALEVTRLGLLGRSRAALQQSLASDSPESYLSMTGGKSLPALGPEEPEQPEEYVDAEKRSGQRGSLQHYYEAFQDFHGNKTNNKNVQNSNAERELDNVMLLYVNFSAAQAKEKEFKSGPLIHLKRERKMFAPFNVFWLNRSCWVSLVGNHLLLYGNERESRPYLVESLQGYKARPAPDALVRNPRRSEAAFEIYCPGDRTFQFLAKNAQEMKEWVDAVSEGLGLSACGNCKGRAPTFVEILELESNERIHIERMKEERGKYQDVFNTLKTNTKDKKSVVKVATDKEIAEESKEEAPPLPARTRRLPSLPSQEGLTYEPREELYDEEGLYHRIDDIKTQREYQNCSILSSFKEKSNLKTTEREQETYDDVKSVEDKSKMENSTETYDDVQNYVQDKKKDEPISYDDVQTVTENLRVKNEKENSPKSLRSSQKRSFFDRVRSRKESMKKDDRKPKPLVISAPTSPIKTNLPPIKQESSIETELPCYDDISSLTSHRKNCAVSSEINEENYLSPPPPRPIYSRPPTIIKCIVPREEIYDDIGSSIDIKINGCKGCANVDVIKDYPKNNSFLSDLQLSIDHYQVPKLGNRRVDEYHADLYDDVTLSETFQSRQRDTVSSSSSGKSVWSRFSNSKKPRIFDQIVRQTSCSDSTDTTDDSSAEQQSRVKPFQKLISKVETTLNRAAKPNGVTQT